MPEVHLWAGLRAFADGAEVVRADGATVGAILRSLAGQYPGMADMLEDGVSVSVDGKIIVSDLTEPVPEDAEVWVIQRLRGG